MPLRPSRKSLLTNHQRCWIWGRHVVQETLQVGRWPVLELCLAEDLLPSDFAELRQLAHDRQIPVKVGSRQQLTRWARHEDHQGCAAKMGEFPYSSSDDLWSRIHPRSLFVMLEAIHDSFNFGTLLRSCEVFAVDGIVIGDRQQSPVNSQVARSSVGAVNRLLMARVPDLIATVKELQTRGVSVIGTSLQATTELPRCQFDRPVAVVIGNEAHGLSEQLLAACSETVRIPQPGTTNSLNAAAALAIACYEVRRQQ